MVVQTKKVKRLVVDLGNSRLFAMFDGDQNIIEIPTAVLELDESRAKGYFTDKIPPSQLKNSLMLKYKGQYLLIGEAAQNEFGSDNHIGNGRLHEKSESELVMQMFLAAIAIYDAETTDGGNEDTKIEIDYFSTMLPVWELVEGDSFGAKTKKMANRFLNDFSFEVITNGCEKTIDVSVKESKCYEEGRVAKFALKYNFDLTEKDSSSKFDQHITINNDIGGGTIDQVRLWKRLANPKNRDDFNYIVDVSYLNAIKQLYQQKLIKYFSSLRDLEDFIVNHYENHEYVLFDSISGAKTDLSQTIEKALRDYTFEIMPHILRGFPTITNEEYVFNYYGGVAPIIKKYIKEFLVEKIGEERCEKYHHFESDRNARFLNLYGLEIIARQNTLAKK